MGDVIPLKAKALPTCIGVSRMRTLADQLRTLADQLLTAASSDVLLVSDPLKESLAHLRTSIEAFPDTAGRDILFRECSRIMSALEQAQDRLRLASACHASLSGKARVFL
jgi:hypothetical protein